MKPIPRRGPRQVSAAAMTTLVVVGLSVTAPTAAAQSDSGATDQCPALHVLLAPGTSETSAWSDPNQDNHGYLSKVIKPVINDANDGLSVTDPGAGFSQVLDMVTDGEASKALGTSSTDTGDTPKISRTTITYPSTAGGAFMPMPNLPKNFGDMTSYEQSVAAGVAQMESVSQEIIDNCENTEIAALGYSQGAEVTSSFARSIGSGESSIPDDRIAAIALFSDPTREGGTPALVNGEDTPQAPGDALLGAVDQTMTGLSKIETPAASGLSPEKTGIDHFGTLSDRTVSWCLPGDYVCGLPAESEMATEIAGLVEQISLEDPIEALTLLAESMDSAVKISDFEQVADINFGEDGFSPRTAGLVDNNDKESSVLAERAAAAASDFTDDSTTTGTNPNGVGMSAPVDDSVDEDETGASETESAATEEESPSATESTMPADEFSTDSMPEVDDSDRAADSLPGTHNDTDETSTPSSDAADELLSTEATESSDSETSTATEEPSQEPTESEPTDPQTPAEEAVDQSAEEPDEPKVDPFSSPEAFANAAIPAASRLGGMALGTGITVVKDTLTPQNIGQIAIAGVAGGPQAAATVAAGQFAQSGMKLLEPGMASGKAREVLSIVEDSGFEVPEVMKIAVELSAWLSVTEHIEYGNRAMMPDGRTAEKATQDWLLSAAGDSSGDAALTDDLMGQAMDFGMDALTEVAFDPKVADMATTALKEVTG